MANEFDSEAASEPEISVAVLPGDPVDAGPLVGERFGKYLLVGELASGGMAQIFLAVHEGLEGFSRVVALKRVLPYLTESSEFVQMFLDEARIAARLEHPNIVRTYEFGTEAGRYFIEMEYLAGEDVSAVLNRAARLQQRLPISFVVEIMSRVCAGLHFAHNLNDSTGRPLGLVHRDVTPGNIVVTYFGEVKLIDFGVAKAATNNVRTRAGMLKGKIAYMSPEQLRARGIDRRSDVFSTGVVLWELLTGARLFSRDSDAATLYAILDDPVPPVRTHRPEVPAELAAIVERALARTPDDRWATAEDMQLALDGFLAAHPRADSVGPGVSAGISPSVAETGARRLAREMERLFGAPRTHAKRCIAQNRSLAANIAVVTKLQSDVLAGPVGSFAETLVPQPPEAAEPPAAPRSGRGWVVALLVGAIAIGLGAGLAYVMTRHDAVEPGAAKLGPAALTVTSHPAGAAIYVAGEPTGMTTPATLANIAPGRIAIRLELAGYPPAETAVELAPGASVTRDLELGTPRAAGRLVLMNLPAGAVVLVDGDEHPAGEVIPVVAGRHTVQVVSHGQTITQQTIETTGGDQIWELANQALAPRRPR